MKKDKGGGGDRADAPGAEADPAQGLEGGLEQRVAAFGRGPGGRVQQVDGALVGGQPAAGAVLDRRGQCRSLAFVPEVGQRRVVLIGPLGQQRQRLGVAAQGGGVVLATGPYSRGPYRPAVGAATTWMLPPWAACLPDHHRSTRRSGRSARAVS